MQAEIEREICPPELRRRDEAVDEEAEGEGVLKVGRWVVGEGILLPLVGEFTGRDFLGKDPAVEVGDGGFVFIV